MKNPWLEIGSNDYVAHMSSPEVGQYQMINEVFRQSLEEYKPRKLFVPGCTIGNGFEHIDWNNIEKVTALDINLEYLQVLREKYSENKSLQIENKDIINYESGEKYDLIFTALILEYVDFEQGLIKLRSVMYDDSTLVILFQIESAEHSKVSKTKYKSLEKVGAIMNLVDITEFESICDKLNLRTTKKKTLTLNSGKSFCNFHLKLI